MKKYFVYLMMALATVTFNACSDDEPLQEEPGTEQPGNQDDNEGTENPDEPNTPDEPSGDSNNILVATVTTFLWHTSAGAEPHSGWHNRLSNKLELICSA